MAHILRKYISNRGSALFMVISTMTALIISCMAMYFTMVSARSSQYAVFGQMQATQTAQSVLEIARGSLNPYNKLNPEFKDKLLALEEGESITTDANGFLVLDPNDASLDTPEGKTPAEIGAYSVTITCISKTGSVDAGNLEMEFDYLVMSSFNGSRDALHFTQKYSQKIESDPNAGADGSGGDAELFAATGYVPNDAYISGGYYLTDVFYDTQYTYMNTFEGSGENRIAQNLYTGGSLMLGTDAMTVVHSKNDDAISDEDVAKIGPITWAIRGDFYPSFNAAFRMRGGSQILVGGNFEGCGMSGNFALTRDPNTGAENPPYTGTAELGDHISIYVNGDIDFNGKILEDYVWLFVNGKVTNVGSDNHGSRIYATSNADTSKAAGSATILEWPKSGEFEDGLTYNEFIELLGKKTQTIAYYKWDLSKETDQPDTQEIDIMLNASSSEWNGLDAYQSTFIISYDDDTTSAPLLEQNGGNELGVVGDSFIINSIQTNTDYNSTGQTIIIDTGDDPDNIINIKLSDITGDGVFSWFANEEESWWPVHETSYKVQLGAINNNMRHVFVVGRGTVLINVPNGITYTASGYGVTGHIGWWLLMGGQVVEINDHINFKGPDPRGKYSAIIGSHVHRDCQPGDGCEFEYNDITDEDAPKCSGCGGSLTQVSCEIHGNVNKFCKSCYPEREDRVDWCKNHVDNLAFEESYESFGDDEKAWVEDSEGEIVYPTTNFMLVSCDESAEMRFSNTKDGDDISYNNFFGFIYAPYMTYLNAKGAGGAHTVKLCGGMTVGDYDLQAVDEFIGCYPDRMPNDLANLDGGGSIAGGKLSGVTKSWKIDIGGYR